MTKNLIAARNLTEAQQARSLRAEAISLRLEVRVVLRQLEAQRGLYLVRMLQVDDVLQRLDSTHRVRTGQLLGWPPNARCSRYTSSQSQPHPDVETHQ